METGSSTYDCIVIGVGGMGSAACDHLARRGLRVLGLERFSIPHEFGSSHGDTRMIRLCYFEHPDYVPLLLRAYELWEELEADTKRQLLHLTGGIYIGEAGGMVVEGTLASAKTHDLPHELLDHDQLKRRYPCFVVPPETVGIYEPRAGFVLPESTIATHAERALRHGAELHGCETVQHIEQNGSSVVVSTSRGRYTAGHAVVCGGAWSSELLGNLGVPLVVTRQTLGWVWPKRPELFEFGTLPVWAIDHADETLHYGFPLRPGRPGFKIGHHGPDQVTTAASVDRLPKVEDEATFREVLRRCIPDADGHILSMGVCLYTNTPDGHFIIDRHPNMSRVVLACGFTGHGFKFTPVIGEVLADLVTEGGTRWPIGFLGLDRFRC